MKCGDCTLRVVFFTLMLGLALGTACDADDDDDNDDHGFTGDDDSIADDDDDDTIADDDDEMADDDTIGDDDDDDDDDNDNDEQTEVVVPADQPTPVQTDISFLLGQRFTIRATDSITLGPGGDPVGPEGNGLVCGADCTAPLMPRGALLARFTGFKDIGNWFLTGRLLSGLADRDGRLQLIINDDDYADNSGGFAVTITRHSVWEAAGR